eukprot:CAMPEP_0194197240 /NCGR_PEP_ID=MMETSP0154-20130528/77098_1 /TAXON_ID=1049557 /ORGANISM="Thalassiothrix antarctica, Strain L6-D1" /LENGTH=511 /DNA_ID=CAMNT_0038921895 /DNA_START=52 /DNA_END=1587 /DNA_ORIENTATION=+
MATALMTDSCASISNGPERFAEEKGLLVLTPGGSCLPFYLAIPSGCYALVTSKGADIDYGDDESAVWPPGFHGPFLPWTGVSHLVTMETVVLDLPVKQCKTKDNVSVSIDVALAFRITGDSSKGEDPGLVRRFVQQVGPRGLEQQLRDAQEEAVRAMARSLKHTEIYGIRSAASNATTNVTTTGDDDSVTSSEISYKDETLEGTYNKSDRRAAKKAVQKGEDATMQMRDRLNRQFEPQGVQILSVMIKSIRLPSDITEQQTAKTMIISKQAQQRMTQQVTMQSTRMEEDTATLLQGFDEQREQETTSGAEALNAEQVKLNDAIAQVEKIIASIKEESVVTVDNITAQNSLEVQRVKNRMYETKSKVTAEAERESAEKLAKTRVEAETILSKARITRAKNEAKAMQIISKAEGEIAPWVEKLKEHETMLRQMEVFKKLANNPDLVISGTSDRDTNLVAVADAIMMGNDNTTSAIMAELALLGNITNTQPQLPKSLGSGVSARHGSYGFTNGH